MKKFFSLICAVVIALGASAAPLKATKAPLALKKVSDLKALATGDLVKKPAKAPKAAQAATIDIAVSNTTATGAQVAITPSDEEAYYVYDFAPASKLQGLTDTQIANDLINSYKEYIIEVMGEEYIYLLPYLFYEGAYEDEFQGLVANTEYVVYAFYVDENGNLQGSVAKKSFKTLELTASKKESISMLNGTLYVYDFGAWQFWGEDANYVVSVTAYADEITGTYKGADLAYNYSYIGKVAGTDTTWYMRADADLTVAVTGQNAVISGKFIGQNEDDDDDIIEFELNLLGTTEQVISGIDGDEETEDFNENFASYTIDDRYYSSYGDLIIEASNDNSASIVLDIYPADGSKELPAGTYPIKDTESPLTVYPGTNYEGDLYPSLAGYTNASGAYTQIWFLVDGTATIAADGTITVEATNSFGKSVKAVLSKGAQGIENIKLSEKAQKIMVDGQMYIILDNKLFNLQGAQVR